MSTDPASILVEELLTQTPVEKRCPHLRKDAVSCWCSSGHEGGHVNGGRRLVCDHMSLQLWCLDLNRVQKCLFYNFPKEFHDEGLPSEIMLADPRLLPPKESQEPPVSESNSG